MVRVQDIKGRWFETNDPSAAVASFIFFDYVKPEQRTAKLFINDKEFPPKIGVFILGLGYPYKIHNEILAHINYCIDTYMAFYDGIG